MNKALPVDYTRPYNSTDVICCICRSPYGGLVYDSEIGTFRHREDNVCRYYQDRPRRH